jgi:RecA/RadA recombinase
LTIIIDTGSISVNRLLGGGIRTGMVTDIYGQSGAGKSQLCFTLCTNYAKHSKQEDTILFVDTAGTFRPERISEIAGSQKTNNLLNKIVFVRALSLSDQIDALKMITSMNSRLVIIDTVTSLFSVELKGATRHLALMEYLHRLSFYAINFDCAIVITNMVRNVLDKEMIMRREAIYHNDFTNALETKGDSLQQREFMGTSLSIYTHIKLRLEIINSEKSLFKASLVQPAWKKQAVFSITSNGISDY